jgi:hypothetical protein
VTPIVVEATRGDVVEASHRIHAVAVSDGRIVESCRDPVLVTFFRSSAKPIQALPVVRARPDLDDAAEDLQAGAISAMMLRHVAEEAAASGVDEKGRTGVVRARLTEKDVQRFERRLTRLQEDFRDAADSDGELHVLSIALFRSALTLPPADADA